MTDTTNLRTLAQAEREELAVLIGNSRMPSGGNLLGSHAQFLALADAILSAGWARSTPVPADAALIGQLEGVKALLGDIYHHGLKMLSIDFDPAYEALEDAVRALRRSAPVGTTAEDVEARIHAAVGAQVVNAINYPRGVAPHILGRDMSLLINKVTNAVVGALEAVSVPHPEPEPSAEDALPWINGHGTRFETNGVPPRPSNDMEGWNCSQCIRIYDPRPVASVPVPAVLTEALANIEQARDIYLGRFDGAVGWDAHAAMINSLDRAKAALRALINPEEVAP